MRKRWLTKAGAVYLAASMALMPTVQATMAAEVQQETSSDSAESLLEESTAEEETETTQNFNDSVEPTVETETVVATVEGEGTSESASSVEMIETESSCEGSETDLIESTQNEDNETIVETEDAIGVEDVSEAESFVDEITEAESQTEIETETAEIETVETETQEEVVNDASDTYESNGYQYTVENGKANLVKYVGSEKNVVIPSKLNGYPVTKLTSDVFRGNTLLESVVIPASITEYEVIGLSLFTNCKSLKYVKIESSADIVDSMFDRCTSLETVEITGKPTAIGACAFQSTKIKSFQIPSSVKKLGYSAFCNSGLEEITIPATVTEMDACVFEYSESLKYVKYESSCNIVNSMFDSCKKLETVEIVGKVEKIEYKAFSETGVKQFTIPSTVISIGSAAFYKSKLQQITIPSTVKYFSGSIFSDCKDLTTVKIESDANIPEEMFYGCENLSNLEITGKPTSIGKRAFYGTKLENAVIPDSVTEIGEGNPFKKSDEQKPSEDGFNYEIVENSAVIVGYNGGKTDVTLPASLGGYPVTKVSSMEGGNAITNLTIPKTITSYEEGAFTDCTALTTVKIESSADIPDKLFCGCRKIKRVEFEGTPSSIGDAAFYGAILNDVVIPSSVKTIGNAAFTRCDASGFLYTVNDGRVASWPGWPKSGEAAIVDYCGKESTIVIPKQIDGYPVVTISTMDHQSFQTIERLTIPEGINFGYSGSGADGIFANRKNLKYVKIETSASIPSSTFWGCEALETVEITGRPEYIGSNAFYDSGLKNINIPSSVKTIDYAAFARCKFENVVIPSSITSVDLDTFASCPNLVSATVESPHADIGAMFYGCMNLKRIELASTVTSVSVSGFNYNEFNNLCGKGVTFYVTEGTPAVELVKDCVKWGFNYVIMGKNQTGLVDMGDNVWYYKVNGVTQWNYTGLVKYYGSWYYVKNGVLDWTYTGLTNYYGTWYYVQKGVLNWGYTGLTNYYGTWYYVEKGVLNWKYTGLTKYYGTWYYVQNSVLNWKYTGLTNYYGTWYYIEKGVLNWKYTGLASNNGGWYYIENGVLNWKYTGLTNYYGTWYHVQKGFLNWNYTGMTKYYGTWYYVQNGALNWKYTGYVNQDGVRYYVKNGVGTVK